MIYTIKHNGKTVAMRKRRDAAALAFERLVYDRVRANALLDTKAGVTAMREAGVARNPCCAMCGTRVLGETLTFDDGRF